MTEKLFRTNNLLLRTAIVAGLLLTLAFVAWRPWEGRQINANVGDYLVTEVNGKGRIVDTRVNVHYSIATDAARMANLEGRYPNAVLIRRSPPPRFYVNFSKGEIYFYFAALAPLAMLIAGVVVRRRERRVLAIWQVFRNQLEVNVKDLLANSDFTRKELNDSVARLNRQGLGFYVWHRDTDVIEDGRLSSQYVQIERCDACGASMGLKVKANLQDVPNCPYCGVAQSAERLNELKRGVIRDLQNSTGEFPAASEQSPLSIPLFIALVVLCWPAAIAYAVYKSVGKQQIVAG